ncbi:MAG: proline--tRNA ligase [Candidatus Altiarchaeia archaeon]
MELMKEEDFSVWYHKVLEEAGILDMRYPIKGMVIYRKWGLFIIREMQRFLEKRLEDVGHEPCLFPVLISEEVLGKETDHIAGFEEQVFWVTHAGKTPLERKLALRPTSETPMYESFSLWIRSHTDLPMKVHQSVSVYRYETKHTRPLIRGREFLWNEGHAAHATAEGCAENVEEIKRIYSELIYGLLCIPAVIDKRPEWDKFPGATETYAFDTLMPDGKTLQIGTAHNLGQNFSRVFNIQFETADGKKEYAYQSSYGPSFGRLLAALIGIHGDAKGLVLPPKIAPIQVVIVPIIFKKTEGEVAQIIEYAKSVKDRLSSMGVRVEIDSSDKRPGDKYYYWEMKGVPLRMEVGPRDLAAGKVVYARRDTGEKKELLFDDLLSVNNIFVDIAGSLRRKAQDKLSAGQFTAKNYAEFESVLGKGIISTGWCGAKGCADKIEETASILSVMDEPGVCVVCGKPGKAIRAAKTY